MERLLLQKTLSDILGFAGLSFKMGSQMAQALLVPQGDDHRRDDRLHPVHDTDTECRPECV